MPKRGVSNGMSSVLPRLGLVVGPDITIDLLYMDSHWSALGLPGSLTADSTGVVLPRTGMGIFKCSGAPLRMRRALDPVLHHGRTVFSRGMLHEIAFLSRHMLIENSKQWRSLSGEERSFLLYTGARATLSTEGATQGLLQLKSVLTIDQSWFEEAYADHLAEYEHYTMVGYPPFLCNAITQMRARRTIWEWWAARDSKGAQRMCKKLRTVIRMSREGEV